MKDERKVKTHIFNSFKWFLYFWKAQTATDSSVFCGPVWFSCSFFQLRELDFQTLHSTTVTCHYTTTEATTTAPPPPPPPLSQVLQQQQRQQKWQLGQQGLEHLLVVCFFFFYSVFTNGFLQKLTDYEWPPPPTTTTQASSTGEFF